MANEAFVFHVGFYAARRVANSCAWRGFNIDRNVSSVGRADNLTGMTLYLRIRDSRIVKNCARAVVPEDFRLNFLNNVVAALSRVIGFRPSFSRMH